MADTELIARQLLSDLKRDYGLTNEQAAGVVGNLMHESGGFQSLQEINPTVPGSRGGYGFGQWTGPRRDAFDTYIKETGLDPTSYDANYGFLKNELATDPYERRQFNTVKKATTAAEAARLVSENYLRPGIPHNSQRVRYAEQILPYANMPVPPGELPSVGTLTDTGRPVPKPEAQSNDLRLMRGPMGNAMQPIQFGPMGTPNVDSLYAGIYAQPDLTQPGAVNASVDRASSAQNSNLAAALARRVAAPQQVAANGSASDRARGQTQARVAPVPAMPTRVAQSYAGQERAAPKPVARSIPAMPTGLAQSYVGQERAPQTRTATTARLPTLPPSAIGQAPATRVVQSVPVTPARPQVSASDRARGNTPRPRISTPLPTSAQIAAATPFGKSSSLPDRLPQGQAALPALYGSGAVAGVGTRAVAPLPQSRTAATPRPVQVAAARTAPVPVARPMAVGTTLDVRPPAVTPVAPIRTPAPVTAPAAPQQPNLLQQMGQNFMTQTPIGRAAGGVGAVASNLAAGRTAFTSAPTPKASPILGRAAPVPVSPYTPMANTPHPAIGLLKAMAGQRQPGSLLASMLGASAAKPPVGAVLGTAANGGRVVQGYNGPMNSITQNSETWKKATGQQDRYTRTGSGSFESASGGTYYDRHIN